MGVKYNSVIEYLAYLILIAELFETLKTKTLFYLGIFIYVSLCSQWFFYSFKRTYIA